MTNYISRRSTDEVTVTDQFCGAGGSSQGVHQVSSKMGGGVEVKLALNHWQLAIDTHNTNFPNTAHDCTDISACDPRRYPSTTILITSPECTNHTVAKGQKRVKAQMDLFSSGKVDAAAERSRATMWDVPRFAEYHQYRRIIVENVVDARAWVLWDSWIHAMDLLGYNHKCVYRNSMHYHPTPQSRDRMYVVFWKKGDKAPDLDYRPKAYCPKCVCDVESVQSWKNQAKKWGKYRQQYVYTCPTCITVVEPYYYAAFNVIDWSNIGTRIGDRAKPLSPNTINRINYGLKKYEAKPMFFHAAYSDQARGVVRPMEREMFTQTTFASQAMVTPFIIKGEHTKAVGYAKEVTGPFQTQTVRQSMGLVVPHIVELNRTGKAVPASENAFKTFTAGVINHGIVTPAAWKSFLAYHYNGTQTSDITEAADSVTTRDRMSLVTYESPKIEDCYYRMIKAHEVKLAMAFATDYVILGSQKDQVKQCGNAVTPPVMEWLVQQCVNSLN